MTLVVVVHGFSARRTAMLKEQLPLVEGAEELPEGLRKLLLYEVTLIVRGKDIEEAGFVVDKSLADGQGSAVLTDRRLLGTARRAVAATRAMSTSLSLDAPLLASSIAPDASEDGPAQEEGDRVEAGDSDGDRDGSDDGSAPLGSVAEMVRAVPAPTLNWIEQDMALRRDRRWWRELVQVCVAVVVCTCV